MAFDFPSSPTEGQIFNAPGGPSYVFNTPVWKAVGQGQIAIISEARNRIVNGAMQISQENGDTPGTTLGYYPADQWSFGWSMSGAAFTIQRSLGPTPYGSPRMIYERVTTAKGSLAAGDYAYFNQIIEGVRVADFQWGTAAAKQVVLRFCIYASYAGTFSVAINRLPSYDRHFVKSFTVAAGEVNTYKYVTIVIPGDTTAGTWVTSNAASFDISFVIGAGTTYSGAADGAWEAGNKYAVTGTTNGAGTINNSINIGDVGLYLDPNATGVPPPWQMPDEADELLTCKRYYENLGDHGAGYSGNVVNGTIYYSRHPWTITKRVTPVIALANVAGSSLSFSGTHYENAAATTLGWNSNATAPNAYIAAQLIGNARM